ncbi:MAG: hypothetical protein ACPHID_04890 [Thermoplasmatota archaeon]
MRFVLLAVLGFALVATGIFLPWGDKEVTRGECQQIESDGDVAFACNMSQVQARYWSDHLRADLLFWQTVDGELASPVSGLRETHDYAMSGHELEGNAGLFWGRPLLWFSMGLAATGVLMLGATRNRMDGARWGAVALWVGAGGMLALGAIFSIGGMIVHSGTWAGSTVSRLQPASGSILVTLGAFAGTFGIVRSGRGHIQQLRGIHGSPLAPVLELEAPEPPTREQVRKARPKLVWTRDILIGLVAAGLIGGAAAAPLAHKDMTFYDCRPDGDGWDCVRYDTEATYITYGVHFRGLNGTTHPGYDDRTRNFDGPLSSGTFTDVHPGHGALGWAYPLWLATAGVTGIGGLMQPWRSRWRSVRAVNIGLLVVVVLMLATAAGFLYYQSINWPGQPAGRLRPAWGLWIVLTGIALLGVLVKRSRPVAKKVVAEKRAKEHSDPSP